MRAERALFLLKPGHAEPLVKHLVKLCQFIRWLNSGPQIFWRVRSAEAAQAANRKIKSFNWQVSGGITYIRQPLSGHTTEKYQCKMQLIRSLPARSSNRLLERAGSDRISCILHWYFSVVWPDSGCRMYVMPPETCQLNDLILRFAAWAASADRTLQKICGPEFSQRINWQSFTRCLTRGSACPGLSRKSARSALISRWLVSRGSAGQSPNCLSLKNSNP